MKKGTVKWFDPKKAYGFITGDDGRDVFVHCSAIVSVVGAKKQLKEKDRVEYEETNGPRGLKAVSVRVVSSAA